MRSIVVSVSVCLLVCPLFSLNDFRLVLQFCCCKHCVLYRKRLVNRPLSEADIDIPHFLFEDLLASTYRQTWRPWRHFRSDHITGY